MRNIVNKQLKSQHKNTMPENTFVADTNNTFVQL